MSSKYYHRTNFINENHSRLFIHEKSHVFDSYTFSCNKIKRQNRQFTTKIFIPLINSRVKRTIESIYTHSLHNQPIIIVYVYPGVYLLISAYLRPSLSSFSSTSQYTQIKQFSFSLTKQTSYQITLGSRPPFVGSFG